MKFVLNKGAPNIPLEVIEAQESETLIFFCGAGISYPAGLPGFSGLVEKVYEGLGEEKNDLESEAIKNKFYDRALGLLEARILGDRNPTVNPVRREIIKQLTIADEANLQTHQAILQLSKTTKQKYRLVTTNVDHGFLMANPQLSSMIDSAPKLPVPKPYKWESIVHLHGILDENDPNGSHMVFTSGDFGSAYLTERWASKFITELFSHFTVLFVGYSINDPVIRYITDAIAAEKQKGYQGFKQPYLIAHTKPSKRTDNEKAWLAKGVKPVLYENSHNNLHKTLVEWANYVRDGLNAKARIIAKEAPNAPLPPYDQDPAVIHLIDVLREKTLPNQEGVTGYPAKVFRELDPPAPIEWLPALDEFGLLSISQSKDNVLPYASLQSGTNLLGPNKITYELWRWFLHHLKKDKLIHWIIDHGSCLHPDLEWLVKHHISNNELEEPYSKFWKIMTSNHVYCGSQDSGAGYEVLDALKTGINNLVLAEISKLMEPAFQLKKSIDWSGFMGEGITENNRRPPYEVEVVTGFSNWIYMALQKREDFPNGFLDLLLPATQALYKALELWEFAGLADEKQDTSHWDLVSISPHQQNRHFRTWVILIEICRDLWEATWQNNRSLAEAIISLWRSLRYPTFRRLVLHANTVQNVLSQDDIIDYLLEDNGWWLWSVHTRREVFRLFARLWPQLQKQLVHRIINFVLKGPPREMFRADLASEEWSHLFDRDIWLMLAKLNDFGGGLPEKAAEDFQELSTKYPDWRLREGERDEFTHWLGETRYGYEIDTTADELFSMDLPDLVGYLSQEDSRYSRGRIDLFRNGCKDYKNKVIQVLRYLVDTKNWNKHIWHAGLVGLADCDEKAWKEIAPLLINASAELYREESWGIAWWAEKAAPSIKPFEEDHFWPIFKLLLEHASENEELDTEKGAVGYAINHPIGKITEALMSRFSVSKLKTGDSIPDGPLLRSVNQIIAEKSNRLLAGKIILASRLNYFYTVDPDWTEKNLIPLFDWQESEFAAWIWQGYLWNPRFSTNLAIAIKEHLIGSIENKEHLGQSTDRLFQLFTLICLEYPNLFKLNEQRDALKKMGPDDLIPVSRFLGNLVSDDIESSDEYWRNRIQPFMRKAWPKSANFVLDETSKNLILAVIQLDKAFAEAVDFIIQTSLLKPISDLSVLIHRMDEDNDLPDTQTKVVLRLLGTVFTEEYQWPTRKFRELLNRMVTAAPEIVNEQSYKRMDNFLTERGL